MSAAFAYLRAALFYSGYALFTIVWGTLSVLICWALPYRARFAFIISVWTRAALGWLRLTCGVRHRVQGLEHLPAKPCVVLVQHQSTWEAAFAQTVFAPASTAIKRELLFIPFFGWAYALLKPIAINRNARRNAVRQLIDIGRDRLDNGQWVVLYPEGSRQPRNHVGDFFGGGAALAHAASCPIVVVAHNAGAFWPAHEMRKRPGTIDVIVSPPIEVEGRSRKQLNEAAHAWLLAQQSALQSAAEAQLGKQLGEQLGEQPKEEGSEPGSGHQTAKPIENPAQPDPR